MGNLGRRLDALEGHSRAQAAAEVRRAWETLTDEEWALILAPFYFGRAPTPQESAAEASFLREVPEALIARAVGYFGEEMAEEELDRRVDELLDPVLSHRRTGVRHQLARMEGVREASM
jgi:hypothetical protein